MTGPLTREDLWVALALMAVVEGVLYAAFPNVMRRVMAEISTRSSDFLRLCGLALAGVGFAALWVLTHQ